MENVHAASTIPLYRLEFMDYGVWDPCLTMESIELGELVGLNVDVVRMHPDYG